MNSRGTPGFFREGRQHGTSCGLVLGDATCGLQIAQDFRLLHRTTRASPAKISPFVREALPGGFVKCFGGVAAPLDHANAKSQRAPAASWPGTKVQTGGGCAARRCKMFQKVPAAAMARAKTRKNRVAVGTAHTIGCKSGAAAPPAQGQKRTREVGCALREGMESSNRGRLLVPRSLVEFRCRWPPDPGVCGDRVGHWPSSPAPPQLQNGAAHG